MPAAPAYLWQVTLNTGSGSRSLRANVTEQALVVARPLLDLEAEQSVADLGLVRSEQYGSATILRVRDESGPRCAIGVALRSRDRPGPGRLYTTRGSPRSPPLPTIRPPRPGAD